MEAKGVISIELTIGSKSQATTFFIVEVQAGFRNLARRCSFPIGALKNAEWLRDGIISVYYERYG
jgi:hypothetical protein